MNDYHGIFVDTGFKYSNFIEKFEILGSKESKNNPWILYKVRISEIGVNEIIKSIQNALKDEPYYAHLYRKNELVVVFKHEIFRISPERSTWEHMIKYGISIGIPEEQLNIKPCRFEDETY